MTVTKQQQLEFAAKHIEKWKSGYDYAVIEETSDGHLYVRWPSICTSGITKKDWQQERDKMQNKKSVITGEIYLSRNGFRFEVVDIAKAGNDCSIDMVVYMNLDATNDFSPGQKWVLELESFVSKFKLDGCGRLVPDNSWHDRGELPPVGTICEMLDDKNTWLECEIIAHKNSFCIGWVSSRNAPFYTDDKSDFHPLRTEREKAIDELNALVGDIEKYPTWRDAIAGIIDYGYRKGKP